MHTSSKEEQKRVEAAQGNWAGKIRSQELKHAHLLYPSAAARVVERHCLLEALVKIIRYIDCMSSLEKPRKYLRYFVILEREPFKSREKRKVQGEDAGDLVAPYL